MYKINKKLNLFKISLYMFLFYILWDIGSMIGRSTQLRDLRNFYSIDLYGILLRILFCILSFVFLKYYEKDLKLSFKDMFSKFDMKVFSVYFSVLVILELIMMFVLCKKWNFNFNNISLIFYFISVGLMEELVCRGCVFNALNSKIKYKKANIIQTIYFAVWHIVPYIPVWIARGAVNIEQLKYVLIWNIPASIVVGLLFGHILEKTKSLWIPIILHTFTDYLASLLYM